MKRTVGAKGKPGRKGRGTAPRIKKEPLFQEAKADVLGEDDMEALQLRKQRARIADFYFHMRRAPMLVTEEVEGPGPGVEEERSGISVRYIARTWKQCGCRECCNNELPSINGCSSMERQPTEAARRPYDAFIIKGRAHLGPETERAPKTQAFWDPEATMPRSVGGASVSIRSLSRKWSMPRSGHGTEGSRRLGIFIALHRASSTRRTTTR